MSDLYSEVQRWLAELDESIEDFKDSGIKCAYAEQAYRLEAAKEIARLRDLGTPVTIIDGLIKGAETVSKARLERTVEEVYRDVAKERIQAAKKHIAILSDEIEREWNG